MSLRTRFRQRLLAIESFLAGTLLLVMAFTVFLQVITRYVFALSLSWPEEFARFVFTWAALLSACVAVERKKLHDIDFLHKTLPPRGQLILSLCIDFLVIAVLLVLIIHGSELARFVYSQASPAMEISMTYVYAAVPTSAILMLTSTAFNVVEHLEELWRQHKGATT